MAEDRETSTDAAATERSVTAADRRAVIKAAGAAGLAAGIGVPTYLRGFSLVNSAEAQTGAPLKVGFIEDESGNLSVYGLQKLHAAQLAVKEINEGKTLKGAAGIGGGMLGVEGNVAKNPPVISRE